MAGADGVAGELPSGVITQDGVTYVPLTGRALQTEGVAIPTPENAAAPFTRPFEAWVGSHAGEGAAREVAKTQQEKQEREMANQPPGEVPPETSGLFCGGEYGPCPEEGEPGGGGGACTGMQACTASYKPPTLASVGCSPIEAAIFVGAKGTAAGRGSLLCHSRKAELKVKVCIYIAGINSGEGAALTCGSEHVYNSNQVSKTVALECAEGSTYYAYAWGYVYGLKNYEGYVGYARVAEGGNESEHSQLACNSGPVLPPGAPGP